MPDTATTARAVFAELNAIAERHQADNHMLVLAAIMAWVDCTADGIGVDTLDAIEDMACHIADLAEPVGAMH